MNNVFLLQEKNKTVCEKYELSLATPKWKYFEKRFYWRGLKPLGPIIWNSLPYRIHEVI